MTTAFFASAPTEFIRETHDAAEVLANDEEPGDALCAVQATTFERPSLPSTRAGDAA